MLTNKQSISSYSLLILLGLVLSCYIQTSNAQNGKPAITLEQNNGQSSTYFINGLFTDGSRYVIEPEFPEEGYLFTPIHQVSFSTAHMFKTNDFKYNQLHIGNKYHYYQTDKQIFMGRLDQNGLQMTNFAEISIPDIIFSQQVCTHIVVDPKELYSISACRDNSDSTIYLVMVSYISSKPFYVQALKTSLKEVSQMRLAGQFLYVLDHDDTTNTNEKLHIYKVNLGNSNAKQAMEITGYIDHSPFNADNVDIGSFDINEVGSIQKIFLADKTFGLRTIDFNTETQMLYNALSNSMNNDINSIAVHTCTTVNSCYLVVSNQDSTLGYASWGRNGNDSAFDFISVFALPKHVTINQKLTISQNFLTVMSQANEGNRLHVFSIPTDKFTNPISIIGAVDYKPVSSYQNDFMVVCTEQDGSCKLFVPNPVNHIEEYIFRPQLGVKIQSHAMKSTYFNLISTSSRTSTVQTVRINNPNQRVEEAVTVAETQPTTAPAPAPTVEESGDLAALLREFRPNSIPIAMMPGVYMKQQSQGMMGYGQGKLGANKNKDNDSDDDTSLTTFHGWFIIFLVILAALAGVAYLTNRPEKSPVVANVSTVEAPSVLDAQPIRRHLIDESSEIQVTPNDDAYTLMPEEPQADNLLQVDTGLENDTHEIDLEATK